MSFQDHGTGVTDAVKVVIRKDDFIVSKPWHADLVFPNGDKWVGWQSFYSTKKNLIRDALGAAPDAQIVE